MKNILNANNKTLWLLILSVVGVGVGYWFGHSYESGLCYANFDTNTFDVACHQLYEKIGNALFYSMQAIALVFLVLLFVPRAFSAWKKFAVWFLPLMFIYFALYKNEGFFSVPEESVYRFLSITYAVISLLIIGWVAVRVRKSP
jgi:hypothetical protein